MQAFDSPYEIDDGIGSGFDEPIHIQHKAADEMTHNNIRCCRRYSRFMWSFTEAEGTSFFQI